MGLPLWRTYKLFRMLPFSSITMRLILTEPISMPTLLTGKPPQNEKQQLFDLYE
jgi:hypothetical protein